MLSSRVVVSSGFLALLLILGTSGQTQTTPPVQEGCHDNPGVVVDCPPRDPEMPVYFPYPYDCTKFIECTNGEPKVHCCAPGTVWNQTALTCDHYLSTPCIIVSTTIATTTVQTTTAATTTTPTTTTPTTTTPTTTTPNTTTPTTTTPTTTTPTTTTPTTTSDDPAGWICPPGYLGPIAHPYTCTQFYICDPANRPCLYDCPGDLYFDPNSRNCEWPELISPGLCDGGTPPPYVPWTTPASRDQSYRNAKRSYMNSASFEKVKKAGPCDNPVTVFYRVRD